LQRGFESALFI